MYLSYYSRPRLDRQMNDEEIDKEIQYTRGRIITKEITECNLSGDASTKLFRRFMGMTNSMSSFIDTNEKMMNNISNTTELYSTFKIPKHSGGYRTIVAPDEDFKELLRNINKYFIKDCRFLAHNAAHGFVPKRNCKTAVEVHQANQNRWFLKVDIHDFFGSITELMVENAIKNTAPVCKYIRGVRATQLATLCTIDKLDEETSTVQRVLPQGAPTSPTLSNMVMVPYDIAISNWCKAHQVIYTRYADDMLFSSKVEFDKNAILELLAQTLPKELKLSEHKTRYGNFNGRNWNLGLMYNNEYKITVGHARKKLVKNMLHNYKTKPNCATIDYELKLGGILGYCAYIEPNYFAELLEDFKATKENYYTNGRPLPVEA